MKHRFRFQILCVILLVAFCIMAIFSFYEYDTLKRSVEETALLSMSDKMEMQADRFDDIMQTQYLLTHQIAHSAALTDSAQQYLQSSHGYDKAAGISEQLSAFLTERDLEQTVYLYLPQTQQVISSNQFYVVRTVKPDAVPWLAGDSTSFSPLFFQSVIGRAAQMMVAYAAPLKAADGTVLGTVCTALDERSLYYSLFGPLKGTEHSAYYILLPDQTVASAKNTAQIGAVLPDLPDLTGTRVYAGDIGNGQLFAARQSAFTGCRLVYTGDSGVMTENVRDRQTSLLLILALAFWGLLVVSISLSGWLYHPLESMMQAIDRLGAGDFSVRLPARKQQDEFQSLYEHFNDMVSRIDHLLEENVRQRTEKKHAELRALQYQIRPHFMYNTLNSIRFAASMQRNTVLADQLGAFIALLEASVQRKGAFITVQEECQLVEDFVALEKFRYSDCFSVQYDIAEAAKSCYIPCLLLQPVIENAIFHGIDARSTDNRIVLTAAVTEKRLQLCLTDYGKGMDRSTLQSLLSEEQHDDKRRLTGIGLRNIQERLRLYYGEQAAFRIESRPREGTKTYFDLPVSHCAEEYGL